MNTLEKAIRLNILNAAKKRIEDDIDALKQELIEAYPGIEQGDPPPYFLARATPRVELFQDQAHDFYMKHKDLRKLFKLGMGADDFKRVGTAKIGKLNVSYSLMVDKKAVEAAKQDAFLAHVA